MPYPLPLGLQHYTSINGVRGILESKELWASNLHFLNDSSEWVYTLDLVRTELRERTTARPGALWQLFITKLVDSIEIIASLSICIFAFSEAVDQLSQWRSYCPRDGGYALQFDVPLLVRHLQAEGFQLGRCEYDYQTNRTFAGSAIAPVLANVPDLANEGETAKAAETSLNALINRLYLLAPLVKHSAFREECEWRAFRLVPVNDPRMHFHIRDSMVIPHCKISLAHEGVDFPIRQVVVGPGPHHKLAFEGLMALTRKYGVHSITRSLTPYRGF